LLAKDLLGKFNRQSAAPSVGNRQSFMSYQVIARKWRPQTFDEVTGQEHITRTLCNAIEYERLHHAYLFSGARGVGKTTTARLLAKALNCHSTNQPTVNPCGVCASCIEIAESRSIDVLEIDAASNTGVDNVREAIIGSVAISPARDRYKIFIIDEVHMLSGAAFNALLKTLEEPPPRVAFIMATTELHKVPDTITSRCQEFEFRTIALAKIAERLRFIADEEKVKISDEALREIARAGEGSMRDAQSAFDQVISFSGNEITKEDVSNALGLAGTEMLTRIIDGIANNQPQEALKVVADLVMRGQDLRNFCRDLLSHLRDLLVAKVAGDSDELLESSAFDYAELKRQAANFNESDLVRFFHSLSETETSLKTASNARYQLEIGLVKLMEMRKLAPLSQILERLNQLEETLRTGKTIELSSENISIENAPKINKPTPSNVPTVSSSSKSPSASIMSFPTSQTHSSATAAAPAFEEVPFEGVGRTAEQEFTLAPPVIEMPAQPQTTTQTEMPKENFYKPVHADNSILGRIKTGLEKRKKHLLAVAIDNIARAKTDDNEISFDIAPEDKRTRETFNKPDNMKLLREVACEVLGKQVGIRFASVEQNGDTPQSQEDSTRNKREALRQEVENHPLVQKTLNIFQGEIIEFSSKD
jgi:DNA polymerase-3 subunit gamma/tau